ncbi:hypothetical protein Amsp01_010110 [Amycolatopsis sp. NBRC 101858]|nr:hypothetical protein Amsp01_010110 [Amycolatopsis sp. NBRC 101858]
MEKGAGLQAADPAGWWQVRIRWTRRQQAVAGAGDGDRADSLLAGLWSPPVRGVRGPGGLPVQRAPAGGRLQ